MTAKRWMWWLWWRMRCFFQDFSDLSPKTRKLTTFYVDIQTSIDFSIRDATFHGNSDLIRPLQRLAFGLQKWKIQKVQ
jgi:hypothetical protein